MKACLLFVLLIFTSNTFSQNVSPQFSELKGMEDQSGNTHLFYRIYSHYSNDPFYNTNNDIYHLDLETFTDSLFLTDYSHSDPVFSYYRNINDYEFWNNETYKFIYGGTRGMTMEGNAFIRRFDSENNYNEQGVVSHIQISKQNDSLLYAGGSFAVSSGLKYSLKSTDGGWNWTEVPGLYEFVSVNPFDDQALLAQDVADFKLFKTTDGGNSFYLVDSLRNYWEQQYHYDPNENHIYRVVRKFNSNDFELRISSNEGEAFSWALKYSSPARIFISNNASISGTIYLANKKNIFLSTDYGDNFNLYKSLERNIVGIYKKPNSDKLYAATKYKIYQITPDSIQVIKSLPIPEEVFAWYPLNLGDKWIYDKTFYVDGDSLNWVSIVEVKANKTFENNVYFEVLVTDIGLDSLSPSGDRYELFRTDSSYAKVYKAWFDSDSVLHEELHMHLIVEVGDTIPVGNGIYLESEEPVTIFGLNSRKRTFIQTQTPTQQLELVNGLGKIYEYIWELAGSEIILKGCIINGVVYGDTTVVSVEDEAPSLPTEFSLSQNYPNPFNPSTKISWQSPVGGWQTLKVYDILGNEIATLVNEELPAGEYEVEFNSRGLTRLPDGQVHQTLPSGIYFYQLRAGDFVQTRKMLLLK